jgi:asparagine synthase (glutamine-hydrolysing)
MSAIFGWFNWNGAPVAREDVARMERVLTPYGADGGGLWADRAASLGQRQSWVTAEDRFERQPLATGDTLLVSDARIDNRDELLRAWSVPAFDAATWPDSQFVARAIETWGDEAPARLRGAFAFAHWDRAARRLMLARSPLSERPLFYHASSGRLVFASLPQAIFAGGAVRPAIDETFLADYLALERLEPGRTFFRGVQRVPAGHLLIVTDAGAASRPFWHPERIRPLRLSSDREYLEAFDELFARVVADAIRGEGDVGLMLSGGLDSSSVAAVAAPALACRGRRLAAFTEVPPSGFDGAIVKGRYADETPFVQSLARRIGNLDLTLVRTDGRFFLDHLEPLFEAGYVPVLRASNLVWIDAVMAEAKGRGVRVLLHAGGGNMTISWNGAGALAELVGRGHWRRALREAKALAPIARRSAPRVFLTNGILPWLPAVQTGIHGLRSLASRQALVRHSWRAFSAVNPAFADAHGVRARARMRGDDSRLRLRPDTRTPRWQTLQRGGDLIDGHAAGCQRRFGLELRDPTTDIRLLEFCLSLPEDQYQRDGEQRRFIRQAMRSRLPQEILDNRLRGLQAADWLVRMQAHGPAIDAALDRIDGSDLARRAIDVPRLRRLAAALPAARADCARDVADYRGVLEQGLMAGSFLCWADSLGGGEA